MVQGKIRWIRYYGILKVLDFVVVSNTGCIAGCLILRAGTNLYFEVCTAEDNRAWDQEFY